MDGNETHKGKLRNAYTVLVGKTEGRDGEAEGRINGRMILKMVLNK
jgi:hypothetical protein